MRLLSVEGSEEELLAALLFEAAAVLRGRGARGGARAAARRARGDARPSWSASAATAATGPAAASRRCRYRFEVVSDYGAFRDLQRHRMLTVQWQTLGPELGAGVPEELDEAGVADALPRRASSARAPSTPGSWSSGRPELAPYALCLGYRIRYVLDMNAREAMHLIELRSGREGHPATAPSRTRCTPRSRASTRRWRRR